MGSGTICAGADDSPGRRIGKGDAPAATMTVFSWGSSTADTRPQSCATAGSSPNDSFRRPVQHQVLYWRPPGDQPLRAALHHRGASARKPCLRSRRPAADVSSTSGPRRSRPSCKKLAARAQDLPRAGSGARRCSSAMVDPADHAAVAQVGYSLGYIVRPVVVPEFRMTQLLRDHYGVDERWRFTDTHSPRRARPAARGLATARRRASTPPRPATRS